MIRSLLVLKARPATARSCSAPSKCSGLRTLLKVRARLSRSGCGDVCGRRERGRARRLVVEPRALRTMARRTGSWPAPRRATWTPRRRAHEPRLPRRQVHQLIGEDRSRTARRNTRRRYENPGLGATRSTRSCLGQRVQGERRLEGRTPCDQGSCAFAFHRGPSSPGRACLLSERSGRRSGRGVRQRC